MKRHGTLHTGEMILCALFTALIAAGAFIRVPVPVVPFTLQFLFTNLAALLLGGRLGSISVAVYLLIGLIGFPVFTAGGGLSYVFQPTFGYLLGFLLGAYLAGRIIKLPKAQEKPFRTALFAGLINLAAVYALGMAYYFAVANYYTHSPIGVFTLFLYCFILAVPGDLVLCFLSAALYCRLAPSVSRLSISYGVRTPGRAAKPGRDLP